MGLTRRGMLVYGLLIAVWALVVVWQVEEHLRVEESAKTDLRSASKDIANTVSACIRASSFRQAVFEERLISILDELVNGRTNELVRSRELLSLALLNSAGSNIVQVGPTIDADILQEGEHWGRRSVTFVTPVNLGTNIPVLLPPRHEMTNNTREGGAEANAAPGATNATSHSGPEGRRRQDGPGPGRLSERVAAFRQSNGLAGLVLAISTNTYDATCTQDLWLRAMICLLATVSTAGSGLAWRNLVKS